MDVQTVVENLRNDVTELRVGRASADATLIALTRNVETLSRTVGSLTATMTGLKETIDKSRGALWVIGGISAGTGAIATLAATAFFHK